MHQTGQIYRPPSEASVQRLEVTIGCSHNKCSFCTMYRKTPFRVAPLEDVEMDLKELHDRGEKITRIYLTNGDPFVLGTDRLVKIAELVHQYLPEVEVLTCYASIRNLKAKSLEDLKLLKSVGYDELYVGLETAYAPAVKLINKGFTVEEAYENIGKLKEAGMKYSALLMLGIGGKGHSKESVEATAALLNNVQLTERELIEEEKMLLRALKINDCIFFGSHPYNLITISGVLPQDREEIIKHLDSEMAAWDRDQPGFLDTVWKRTDM